jgi:hypothetical protein
MRPFDVETMQMPKPFKTRGNSPELAYRRKPGVDNRFNSEMAGRFDLLSYRKAIFILPWYPSSSNLKFNMYPL